MVYHNGSQTGPNQKYAESVFIMPLGHNTKASKTPLYETTCSNGQFYALNIQSVPFFFVILLSLVDFIETQAL